MPIEAPPATAQVPLISGRVMGPLGIAHLPRLWLKLRLHAVGRLPEGYRHGNGGSDEAVMTAIGVDPDALIGYIAAEAPNHQDFEAWVQSHATKLGTASIDDHNASIMTFDMPEPRRSDWAARFGLDGYTTASRLNELDDWDLVHAQIVAPGAATTLMIPAISTSSMGPLGVAHLPRVWLKMLLHSYGRLPKAYRYGIGGFDETMLVALGIPHDPLLAFVTTERPGYLALEAWVREHATNLTPAAIAHSNETILGRVLPEDRCAERRREYGVTDPTIVRGVALNDIDDWLQLHEQLIALR